MTTAANNPRPDVGGDKGPNGVQTPDSDREETLSEQFMDWVRTELVWYAGSFSFHLLALSLLLLLPSFGGGHDPDNTPVFTSAEDQQKEKKNEEEKDPIKPDLSDIGAIVEPPALKIDTVLRPPTQIAEEPMAKSVDKPIGGGERAGKKDDFGGRVPGTIGPGPASSSEAGILSNNHPGLGDGIRPGSGDTLRR
jgi:hypothetical protein